MIVPDWPAPPHVRAVFSERYEAAGVSLPPYDALNLGDHVGDLPHSVAQNREIFEQSLQGAKPVFLKQVHGIDAIEIRLNTPHGSVADACYATERGLACTMMVADCLPGLFAHKTQPIVAAAHAGWRGLCGQQKIGVLEQIFNIISEKIGVDTAGKAINLGVNQASLSVQKASDWMVWLGPCISSQAFEVGAEVRSAFMQSDPAAELYFKAIGGGKYLANLSALARQRLAALGIENVYGNDGSAAWCTASNPSRFFSHRRDGVSGRMAASIWLV